MILAFVFSISVLALVSGQDYKTGLGLRAGTSPGLTVKQFLNRKAAFEGLVTFKWGGLDISGLYEVHNMAFEVDQLNWYYGFGAHIGFWDGSNTPWGHYDRSYAVIGAAGILGIEYSFSEVPINVGIDWKPVLNIVGDPGLWADEAAISVRYIF